MRMGDREVGGGLKEQDRGRLRARQVGNEVEKFRPAVPQQRVGRIHENKVEGGRGPEAQGIPAQDLQRRFATGIPKAVEDTTEILLQDRRRPGVLLDKEDLSRAAGSRLKAVTSTACEKVENTASGHPMPQARENGLAGAVGRGPDIAAGRGFQRQSPRHASGDTHPGKARTLPVAGKRGKREEPFDLCLRIPNL